MDNKIGVILVIVCLVIGALAGVLFQIMQDFPKINSAKTLTEKAKVVDILNAKTINSIVVYGQVEKINGKTLTLSYYGADKTDVLINNDAEITSVDSSKAEPVQTIVKFENIKIGDGVNITATISGDYKLLGTSVVIFPVVVE